MVVDPSFCADNEPGGSVCTHIRRISRQRGDSRVWVFDTADNIAIDTIWQKSGVSAIVCREKVKRDRTLWILAERYIILSENAVVIRENGENLIQFGKSETFWQKPVVLANGIWENGKN